MITVLKLLKSVIINVAQYGWSALMYAALRGQSVAAKILIESGADVELKDIVSNFYRIENMFC